MRVVGGRLKGRNIASPSSQDIRPTQDRLRESVFNILVHAYDEPLQGARVLDLFAGTGALGIEAVSRGAAFALFVDNGAERCASPLSLATSSEYVLLYDEAADIIAINPQFLAADQLALRQADLAGALIAAGRQNFGKPAAGSTDEDAAHFRQAGFRYVAHGHEARVIALSRTHEKQADQGQRNPNAPAAMAYCTRPKFLAIMSAQA